MNRTQARKLAQRARRSGFYNTPPGQRRGVYVFCPLCEQRVGVEIYLTAKMADLDTAVIDHLIHDCRAAAK